MTNKEKVNICFYKQAMEGEKKGSKIYLSLTIQNQNFGEYQYGED